MTTGTTASKMLRLTRFLFKDKQQERGDRMYERRISINDVMDAYSQNHKIGNKKMIRKAYEYAATKHKDAQRGSGEPYINHPLRVARFVACWGFESDVIAAALLHDVVEDCHTDLSEINALFGSSTAQIVDAVTALSDKDFADHTLTKAQRDLLSDARLLQKMNEKALYVKIADRIDNLSTIDGVSEEKRIPKAEHTREIIIPMAILEHAFSHVDTLEELCFQIEHPQMYRLIEERSEEIMNTNYRSCIKTMEMVKELFAPNNQPDCSELKPYHQYVNNMIYMHRSYVSIYRQISREAQNIKKDWRKLLVKESVPFYDLTLILSDRILEEQKGLHPFQLFFLYFEKGLSDCGLYLLRYEQTTYGNETFFILADEMDNLYRLFVRTERENNRYMLGNIIDSEGDFSLKDVNEIEPRDTYIEKIRVFDKDGSAVMIDKGATVLDFAFHIHTDLGLHFDYALMEDSKTRLPAYTRLNEGDTITIVANDQVVPNITWFNYIKTRRAVHHLVGFFQGKITAGNDR